MCCDDRFRGSIVIYGDGHLIVLPLTSGLGRSNYADSAQEVRKQGRILGWWDSYGKFGIFDELFEWM